MNNDTEHKLSEFTWHEESGWRWSDFGGHQVHPQSQLGAKMQHLNKSGNQLRLWVFAQLEDNTIQSFGRYLYFHIMYSCTMNWLTCSLVDGKVVGYNLGPALPSTSIGVTNQRFQTR